MIPFGSAQSPVLETPLSGRLPACRKQAVFRKHRNWRGSILLVGIIGVGLICGILLILSIQVQTYLLQKNRTQSAVDAAALAVAGDLSRIIMADEQWGYVALCDQPASGRATQAGDGEPLPILGINTILGTVRLEKLLAHRLNNEELDLLAERDSRQAKDAAARLQKVLEGAISPTPKARYIDRDGSTVTPYEHARQQLLKNIPELRDGSAELVDFNIALGYLSDGSTTLTPDAERKSGQNARKYPAFTNVPAAGVDFYFAGISDQPRLVDAGRIRLFNYKHFRSAILVTTKVVYFGSDRKHAYEIVCHSASMPFGTSDNTAFGSLAIHLPHGDMTGTTCLRDLLDSPQIKRNQVIVSQSVGGDYPVQQGAHLVNLQQKQSLSACVGRALFDWIKTTKAQIRLDTAVQALSHPFNSNGSGLQEVTLVYDVDRKGNLRLASYNNAPISQTVSESQEYILATNVAETSKGMLGVSIRNQVSHTGVNTSGRHGGQPLPLELPSGDNFPKTPNGLTGTLRKSSVEGGLAVWIQLFATPKT